MSIEDGGESLVTIESAYYDGDLWCVYDLKDDCGNYFEDYRLDMRKESQNNKFICPECGEHLILCAGPIMEPYFKHYENSKCVIRIVDGGTRYFLGRRLLYQLAKKSFPEAKILLNHKLNDKYRAGIYIDNGNQILCIEYLSSDMKLNEWEEKHNYFLDNNIIDIWILSNKKYKRDSIQTFEYLISTSASPIIKILDEDNKKILLKTNLFINEIKRTRLLSQDYPIFDLSIHLDGEFECDFYDNCQREIDTINHIYKEERIKKEKKELKVKNDKNKTGEAFVQLSLEDFVYQSNYLQNEKGNIIPVDHENAVKNTYDTDKNLSMNNRKEQVLNHNEMITTTKIQNDKMVVREKLNEAILMNSKKMKMIHINEVWELPDITGKDYEIKRANANRYSYLKDMDKELGTLSEPDRENKIKTILDYLNENQVARTWNNGKSK